MMDFHPECAGATLGFLFNHDVVIKLHSGAVLPNFALQTYPIGRRKIPGWSFLTTFPVEEAGIWPQPTNKEKATINVIRSLPFRIRNLHKRLPTKEAELEHSMKEAEAESKLGSHHRKTIHHSFLPNILPKNNSLPNTLLPEDSVDTIDTRPEGSGARQTTTKTVSIASSSASFMQQRR